MIQLSKDQRRAKDAEARDRARKAKELLKNELFTDAIEAVRRQHLNAIEVSRPSDGKAREDAYHALRALRKIKDQLSAEIESGKLAKKRLDEDKA